MSQAGLNNPPRALADCEFWFGGEAMSAKNSKRIYARGGKRITVLDSEAATAYHTALLPQLIDQKEKWDYWAVRLDKPYHMAFTLYRSTHRRFDYVNMIQGLLDCMTGSKYKNLPASVRWLQDDDMHNVIPYFAPYRKDTQNPGILVTLLNPQCPLIGVSGNQIAGI